MGFELYDRACRAYHDDVPMISVSKAPVGIINRAGVRKYDLKGGQRVRLYYDADRRVVGLVPCHEETTGLKLSQWTGARHNLVVALMGFYKTFSIPRERYYQYLLEQQEDGMLTFDLTKPLESK